MATPLIPQEVYLLERFSSLDYFRPIRDNYEAAVKHAEHCLEAFVNDLPPDYRSRHLSRQPDVVWGERVLPNMRRTLRNLCEGYIMVSHDELNGLGAASEVGSDRRGIVDHDMSWMDEPQVTAVVPGGADKFWDNFAAADTPAIRVTDTIDRYWESGDLADRYSERDFGPLCPPERWPHYRLNSSIQVATGEPIPRNGIYLPDINCSCASLLVAGDNAPKARYLVRIDESVDESGVVWQRVPVSEKRPATWTLIERVPGETIPFEEGLGPMDFAPLRVPAGKACARAGYWFTPAKQGSRRYFKLGDTFPEIEGSSYGATFWQWSPDQSDPKL
ncbi:MAG: hypothetical protein ACREPV_12155 [Lysobacter sp.]